MGFSTKEDEENAYRTSEGMGGRAFRRGVDKGLNAVTLGLWGIFSGSEKDNDDTEPDCDFDPDFDPFSRLAKDAAREAGKAYKRSRE